MGLCRCVAAIMVVAWFLTGCLSSREADTPATKISLPSNLLKIETISLLPKGQLVIGTSDDQIWYQATEENGWRQLLLVNDPQCLKTYYYQVSVLPDGRIGMLKNCTGTWKDSSGRAFHELVSLVAYDLVSGALEPLVAVPLPDSGRFTWSPDMNRGVFSTIGSYSTLYWITGSGTQPITVTLTDGTKSWTLSDSIVAREQYRSSSSRTGYEPHPVGNVGAVTWSPIGNRVAFWATLEPIGQPYNLFREMAWNIYVLDAHTLQLDQVLTGVYNAGKLVWAPDGQWLAYTSGSKGGQPRGIWLLSLHTRKSILIREGEYKNMAWSSDGKSIITVLCSDLSCDTSEVWKYDVSTIVDSAK